MQQAICHFSRFFCGAATTDMEEEKNDPNQQEADTEKKKKKKTKSRKRVRAHVNVFSPPEEAPQACPADVKWSTLFPAWQEGAQVKLVDVGCGFGGLLEHLSPAWPDKFVLGLEIREPVVNTVRERIASLREKKTKGSYDNIGVINMNAMKHLPNFFLKGQLEALFFLYADPHFKKVCKQRSVFECFPSASFFFFFSE